MEPKAAHFHRHPDNSHTPCDCKERHDHSERIQEAAKAVDEDCPLPWEVHGDSPEKPPMIWDAKGDAIVCQMPDGTPYFEAEVAALIVAAVNSISKHIPEQNELREIALLIGSIFFHGNFKAETFNERELEKLLRKNGYFFETEDELLRSLATPSEPLGVTKENK